jgi:hypothetical protein
MLAPLFVALVATLPAAAEPPGPKPPPGPHYTLNLIGFAQCTKQGTTDPDCYNGSGDVNSNGHTIFVPLITDAVDACEVGTQLGPDDGVFENEVDIAELMKGVRIQVSDGDEMQVIDRDATDGLARFVIPDGCYAVWARPLGKLGGCMDIDTLICFDCTDPAAGGDVNTCDVTADFERVDCDGAGLSNDVFVLTGHLDIDRSKGRPRWQDATDELLGGTGVEFDDYFDFLWSIFNSGLRLAQLRFHSVPCG